jgi:hypothetical protein
VNRDHRAEQVLVALIELVQDVRELGGGNITHDLHAIQVLARLRAGATKLEERFGVKVSMAAPPISEMRGFVYVDFLGKRNAFDLIAPDTWDYIELRLLTSSRQLDFHEMRKLSQSVSYEGQRR